MFASLRYAEGISKDVRLDKNRRLYEDIPTANLKETFTRVGTNVRDQFLEKFFIEQGLNEKELCSELFMNEEEIKDLTNNPLFVVGNHTQGHVALTSLDESTIQADLDLSKEWFRKLGIKQPTIFSYPHGLIPDNSDSFLERNGFAYAVTAIEDRAIDIKDNQFRIPRYEGNAIRDFLLN